MEVNFIFLAIESTKVTLQSSRAIPTGIPGKPPPVPISMHIAFGGITSALTMLKECKK